MKAAYIVLEGPDSSGKSTQASMLYEYFKSKEVGNVVIVREPGCTSLGEHLRYLLLDPNTPIRVEAQLLLMQAARAQLFSEVIIPALMRGNVVISDRAWQSTLAYQVLAPNPQEENGYLRELMKNTQIWKDDLITLRVADEVEFLQEAFYISVPFEELERRASLKDSNKDRFEKNKDFRRNVFDAYESMAGVYMGDRIFTHIFNGTLSMELLHKDIVYYIESMRL